LTGEALHAAPDHGVHGFMFNCVHDTD
jgi:hypothetical protein